MSELAANVRIVPLEDDHLEAILKIERSVFRDPWTPGSFVEILGLSDKCWVALIGDDVAGYLITQWVLDEIHILNVAVSREMHRKGVGSALLTFLTELAARHGMRDLFLEVRRSNEAAIALYERFGFRSISVRKKYYTDGEDAFVMHHRLTNVDESRTEFFDNGMEK